MSRLGDTIKQERLRAGWSHKQLAKKSGVSEKFLMEVEAGTRIIADTQATRILKVLGKSGEVFADFESKANGMPEPVAPVRPAPPAAKPAGKAAPAFAVGDRVTHRAFGSGVVTKIQPMGGDALLEVEFETAGTKRLMMRAAGQFMKKKG